MSKLRFLVITELFLPTKGGTAVWFHEVYRRLGDKGTHVVTQEVPGSKSIDSDHPNTIHRLKLADSEWVRPASLPRYLKLFVSALRLAMFNRFSAIHAGRVLPEGLIGLIVAKLTFHQYVTYAHGEEITTWSKHPKRLKAMRIAYRYADKVIANSEFTKKSLTALDVPAEKIAIIHPGVDLERYHTDYETGDLREQIGASDATKLILSVGRLSRRKGFDNVIRALSSSAFFRDVEFCYVIIGIGEDEEYLRTLAKDSGIEQSVVLLGHVSSDELPRWYNACDIYAMPNREIDGDTEGFGMVFMEAAACGKPVVAGDAGGTGDSVVEGVTGYRVNGDDLEDIRRALERLCGDPELAAKMGCAAKTRANREFAWGHVAERTLQCTDLTPKANAS